MDPFTISTILGLVKGKASQVLPQKTEAATVDTKLLTSGDDKQNDSFVYIAVGSAFLLVIVLVAVVFIAKKR